MTGQTDRRNPYVILGVAFGADHASARRGFVRAMRRLKNGDSAIYTEEDVTWALHRIEQIELDPTASVDVYRVPANPNVFDDRGAPGMFNPGPIRMERRTDPVRAERLEQLRAEAIADVLRFAFEAERFDGPLPVPYELHQGDNT